MNDVIKHLDSKADSIEKVSGIVLFSDTELYDTKAQYSAYNKIVTKRENKEDYGFNYLIDQYDYVEMTDKQVNPYGSKSTYISDKLFEGHPEKHTLSINIIINKEHDYSSLEENLIEKLAYLLDKYELTKNEIWRAFDLDKSFSSPLQYLDKEIFKLLLDEVERFYIHVYEDKKDASDFEFKKVFEDNIFEFYEKYLEKPEKYSSQFEPWDKDLPEIIDSESKATVGDLKTKEFPTKNTLQYKITNNQPSGGDHCIKADDRIDAIESNEETMVEPIYPDLITPPGGMVSLSDGFSRTAVPSNSNEAITKEDFEKRQRTFNLDDFSNVRKETSGRPINLDDPYPVDEQIKKLEEHYPKVKIDKVTYDFNEDNHPGSKLGKAAVKNFSMIYDMISEISKRTEQRLVKIENTLSTVTRNLFRCSSRMNINCQYYGGQAPGKYSCIRCLHDNRVDDGAIVTLDQCLCCTRYEPVIGQVYAILDDTGQSVSQIVDDLQASYQDLGDYKEFNNINEYRTPAKNVELTKDSTQIPKDFRESKWKDTEEEIRAKYDKKAELEAAKNAVEEKDEKILITYDEVKDYLDEKLNDAIITNSYNQQITKDEYIIIKKYEILQSITNKIKESEISIYKDDSGNEISKEDYINLLSKKFQESYVSDDYYNGFKMDWTYGKLELQKPNINDYEAEKLKDGKAEEITTEHQGQREIFKDTREDAVEYERLEFNTKDYEFDDFSNDSTGTSSSSSSGVFGGMGASAVRSKIVDYAKHAVDLCAEGKALYSQDLNLRCGGTSNGITYWDCSGLVQCAYQNAGVTGIAGNTASEYPACLDSQGGLLIPIAEIDKAIPGDIIWFYKGTIPTDQAGLQNIDYQNTSTLHHVGIYIGNGQYAHASGSSSNPNIKISNVADNSHALAFGRPKDLIELDKQSASSGSAPEQWSREAHNISDELWNAAAVADSNCEGFISNMAKFGYKETIKNVSAEYGYDPYMIAAMIAIETSGNPNEGGKYAGLLQVEGGSTDVETNLHQAMKGLTARKPALTGAGWAESNIHCLVSAHNSGEGCVMYAAKAAGINLASCTIPELGEALASYVKSKYPSWSSEEKRTYGTKVLRAYNILYGQHVLD